MSCCTRTISPTTTLERLRTASSRRRTIPPSLGVRLLNATTAHVAVVFGGPSPEHDVSILTGLQAARELTRAQRDVIGLYWTKTGEWFRVDASLEAADFVDGVPRGAQSLQLVTGAEGAGFVAGARRLGATPPPPVGGVREC